MINGVILKKLQVLDETLMELRSLGVVTEKQLTEDWMILRAIERDLQIAVEVMIDVCQRLISLAGLTPVESAGDAIERVVQLGALTANHPYRQMVQFRNLVVHHYEQIDGAILVDIVNNRLSDFETFRNEVLAYAQR